jgi:hypothetical protein
MLQRQIRQEEKNLILFLLTQIFADKNYQIPSHVSDLNDGGMGSVQLIQMEYIDLDGQRLIITLTENENQELFELDFWKVDFSPLKKFPSPEKLKKL